jgi:hypothetical protein
MKGKCLICAITAAVLPFAACNVHKDVLADPSFYRGELLPFINADGYYGYCEKDNYGIVIEAQYKNVFPFIGDYAVVETVEEKQIIIDKSDRPVLRDYKFGWADLFSSEDASAVFALTVKGRGLKINLEALVPVPVFAPGLVIPPLFESAYEEYRIYNLTTGKLVTKKLDLLSRIYIIGDYLAVDMDLYQVSANGDVEYLGNDRTDRIINEIIAQRDIPFYRFWRSDDGDELRDGYNWDIKKPDMQKLERIIPGGLLYSESEYVCRLTGGVLNSFYIKDDDLYNIRLEPAGEKSYRTAGIYNDTDGTWLIELLMDGENHSWYPTNDPDIWYDDVKEQLYNVEERSIYSPQDFGIYGRGYSSSEPSGINYPGVYYVYKGYENN